MVHGNRDGRIGRIGGLRRHSQHGDHFGLGLAAGGAGALLQAGLGGGGFLHDFPFAPAMGVTHGGGEHINGFLMVNCVAAGAVDDLGASGELGGLNGHFLAPDMLGAEGGVNKGIVAALIGVDLGAFTGDFDGALGVIRFRVSLGQATILVVFEDHVAGNGSAVRDSDLGAVGDVIRVVIIIDTDHIAFYNGVFAGDGGGRGLTAPVPGVDVAVQRAAGDFHLGPVLDSLLGAGDSAAGDVQLAEIVVLQSDELVLHLTAFDIDLSGVGRIGTYVADQRRVETGCFDGSVFFDGQGAVVVHNIPAVSAVVRGRSAGFLAAGQLDGTGEGSGAVVDQSAAGVNFIVNGAGALQGQLSAFFHGDGVLACFIRQGHAVFNGQGDGFAGGDGDAFGQVGRQGQVGFVVRNGVRNGRIGAVCTSDGIAFCEGCEVHGEQRKDQRKDPCKTYFAKCSFHKKTSFLIISGGGGICRWPQRFAYETKYSTDVLNLQAIKCTKMIVYNCNVFSFLARYGKLMKI